MEDIIGRNSKKELQEIAGTFKINIDTLMEIPEIFEEIITWN